MISKLHAIILSWCLTKIFAKKSMWQDLLGWVSLLAIVQWSWNIFIPFMNTGRKHPTNIEFNGVKFKYIVKCQDCLAFPRVLKWRHLDGAVTRKRGGAPHQWRRGSQQCMMIMIVQKRGRVSQMIWITMSCCCKSQEHMNACITNQGILDKTTQPLHIYAVSTKARKTN